MSGMLTWLKREWCLFAHRNGAAGYSHDTGRWYCKKCKSEDVL